MSSSLTDGTNFYNLRKLIMKYLTIPEIKALLANVPNERQRLMLLVGFNHGLRVSELIGLRGKDIQFGRVYAKRLKGSNATTQPYKTSVDPELDEVSRLTELSKTLGPDDIVFPMTRSGVAKLMKRAGARANIDPLKLHPHALKHSCARAAIKVMPINYVQRYLGHSSLQSTGEYLKASDEESSEAFALAY